MKTLIAALALLPLLLLAACEEAPQQLVSAQDPGYRTDAWPDEQRSRTLHQSEAGRIYH